MSLVQARTSKTTWGESEWKAWEKREEGYVYGPMHVLGETNPYMAVYLGMDECS